MDITVNSTWEAQPAGSDDLRDGDNAIRHTREAFVERLEQEHYMDSASQARHGEHASGSLKAYYAGSEPSNRPSGLIALDSNDAGRVWVDSSSDLMYVYTGSEFAGMVRYIARVSIQGTLSVGTNLVPPIIFPYGCTIKKVSARVGTVPTGTSLDIDLNKNGTTSITGSSLDIEPSDSAANTTTFVSTAADLDADEYLTFDINQVGSTVAGADLSVSVDVRLG